MPESRAGLHGRVAVVTGGSKGLGFAITERLATAGATVAVLARDREHAEASLAGLRDAVCAFACDVGDVGSVERVAAEVHASLGWVDILVNNAGLSLVGQPTHELDDAVWNESIATMQSGVFFCSRAFARGMVARRSGCVINISSVRGLSPRPGTLAYSAAKAAVIAMTKVMAAEWGKHGIRVNAIAPGVHRTAMWDAEVASGELDEETYIGLVPLGRIGDPAGVADLCLCLYLASDSADYITGSCIVIDGGLSSVPSG